MQQSSAKHFRILVFVCVLCCKRAAGFIRSRSISSQQLQWCSVLQRCASTLQV